MFDLDDPQLKWVRKDNRQFEDPLGHVFRENDDYFCRAVHRSKSDIAWRMIREGILDALVKENLIPPQEIIETDHPDYSLVMRAPAARWVIPVHHYPLAAIKTAALAWLRINELLMPFGFRLWDGHQGNFVMFGRGRPTWIDIGSIVPQSPDRVFGGIDEFTRMFFFPLLVLAQKPEVRRSKIFKKDGLTRAEAAVLLESNDLVNVADLLQDGRERALRMMSDLVQSLDLSANKGKWSEYRSVKVVDRMLAGDKVNQDVLNGAKDQRNRVVFELVKSIKPKDILDVGCNVGLHAALFASLGTNVLGFDTDEFSVNSFYEWLKGRPKLNLFAAVENFSTARHKADTVVSLALTHHLALSGKIPFDVIATRYAEMTKNDLIVEFMPNGLGRHGEVRPMPLPAFYRQEQFLKALSRHFAKVDVIDYERPKDVAPRILIHCRKSAS